jgi:hypothetical protein
MVAGVVDLVDKGNGVVLVGDSETTSSVHDWLIAAAAVVAGALPGLEIPRWG